MLYHHWSGYHELFFIRYFIYLYFKCYSLSQCPLCKPPIRSPLTLLLWGCSLTHTHPLLTWGGVTISSFQVHVFSFSLVVKCAYVPACISMEGLVCIMSLILRADHLARANYLVILILGKFFSLALIILSLSVVILCKIEAPVFYPVHNNVY